MEELRLTIADCDKATRELARIDKYYKDNKSQKVRERDPEMLLDAIRDNRVHYVEQVKSKDIVAVGACFRHRDGELTELGGALVVLRSQGLHRLLLTSRIVMEYTFDWPSKHVFSIVDTANSTVLANMQAIGMQQWTRRGDGLGDALESIVTAHKTVYQCPVVCVEKAVQMIGAYLVPPAPKTSAPCVELPSGVRVFLDIPALTLREVWEELTKLSSHPLDPRGMTKRRKV